MEKHVGFSNATTTEMEISKLMSASILAKERRTSPDSMSFGIFVGLYKTIISNVPLYINIKYFIIK